MWCLAEFDRKNCGLAQQLIFYASSLLRTVVRILHYCRHATTNRFARIRRITALAAAAKQQSNEVSKSLLLRQTTNVIFDGFAFDSLVVAIVHRLGDSDDTLNVAEAYPIQFCLSQRQADADISPARRVR
jgi:hypothetical protein